MSTRAQEKRIIGRKVVSRVKPAKPRVMMLRLGITGAFVTEMARKLWAEHDYNGAYDLLATANGTNRTQHDDVLSGKLKLDGLNRFTLLPDNWAPPAGYPTAREVLDRATGHDELEARRQEEATELLRRVASLEISDSDGERAADSKSMLRRARELIGRAEADNQLDRLRPAAKELPPIRRTITSTSVRTGSSDDALLAAAEAARTRMVAKAVTRGHDLTDIPSARAIAYRGRGIKPAASSKMTSRNGWLLPDGKFYACEAMEHVGLAETLLSGDQSGEANMERRAEQLGWIKLSKSFSGFQCISLKVPTERQLTRLMDYSQLHNLDYLELVSKLPKDG